MTTTIAPVQSLYQTGRVYVERLHGALCARMRITRMRRTLNGNYRKLDIYLDQSFRHPR